MMNKNNEDENIWYDEETDEVVFSLSEDELARAVEATRQRLFGDKKP
jgi:hypothetical protein